MHFAVVGCFILDNSNCCVFKFIVCQSLSHVRLCSPWTVAHKTPLSMEFSRQEYWSGLLFPFQRIFLTQGSKPGLLHCGQILYHLSHQGSSILVFELLCFVKNVFILKSGSNKSPNGICLLRHLKPSSLWRNLCHWHVGKPGQLQNARVLVVSSQGSTSAAQTPGWWCREPPVWSQVGQRGSHRSHAETEG